MSDKYDFIVVGAGIVGLASAYKLQLKYPERTIAMLEKETAVGKHQTGRNSGVIHSGIYYRPGSYKAINCKKGREELVKFAKENKIPHDICGKIIVATTAEEVTNLETIFENGLKNATEGIRFLNEAEIVEKEPFIRGIKAIWVPTAGIIDYVTVSKVLIDKVLTINKESTFVPSCEVQKVKTKHNKTKLYTTRGKYTAIRVIFCTGLQADRLAEKDNQVPDMRIVGFRGDYYELKPASAHKVKNLVYPVPDPKFPFLGVHFTRMIHGGVECGPNAVFSFKREGYSRTSFNLRDTFDAITFKGFWKLLGRHWRKGIDEYKRAFSKRLFVRALSKMMPDITEDDLRPARAGVRAQAIDYEGIMVDDFKIIKHKNNIHVLNAPSPAATACLAIADEIINRVEG